MPLTPSKPRRAGSPAGVDDHTDVTSAAALWDGPEPDLDVDRELIHDPDGTKKTGVAIRSAAPVLTPTSEHGPAPSREDYHLEPGTALGEYRIEGKIGQGGMGVVFSAIHPLIGKRAAIKILKKELCADPHQLQRFVDEARVVNEIGHPNIVDVFAFGEMPDGRSYFVMEWLKGETLRARIAHSSMGTAEVSAIIRPLARALEAAHEKGVIHRDLKPDNVFLVKVRGEEPTVKLLDFGIAKLARNDQRVEKTATGAIVGTPQYIAPEQAKGYAIDHRADIYALGGIIYELLTGRPPFVADNAMEMVAKHLMETPMPPSHFAPSVMPELD
ncbi:MAG: serine/threonine protein kinase, partial [Deltaproteobacteria bacterium]|nr:serine/threonine protein kinase [Deltaproteobacteria bacterium]